MFVSLNSLIKYLPFLKQIHLQQIIEGFNSIGIEVEKVINYELANTNVTLGKVIKCEQHPDADKLKVCKVNVNNNIYQIICGASNVKANINVIVALDNAKLANVPFIISTKNLRGIKSEGMICSLNELGINPNLYPEQFQKGIYIFPDKISTKQKNIFKLLNLDNYFFELTIASNRNDCNCVYGLAKALTSYFKIDIENNRKFHSLDSKLKKMSKSLWKVDVQDKLCNTLMYIELKNVKISESSFEFSSYLSANGYNSINNIVDLTNFIMHETGNPIHAYDKDSFFQNKVIVKKHPLSQTCECLGKNKTINLKNAITVSNSKKTPLAVAGIVGLKNSAIKNETKNVLIEIANWNNLEIFNYLNHCNVSTDAGKLFAKSISLDQTINAYNLLVLELNKLKINKVISGYKIVFSKIYNLQKMQEPIILTLDKIDNYLGFAIAYSQIEKYLKNLHYQVIKKDANKFIIQPPSWRKDILLDVDVIEDIISLHGLKNIPAIAPYESASYVSIDPIINLENKINNFLISNSLLQVKTYSLISKEKNQFNFFNYQNPISIANFSSLQRQVMRFSLLSSFLEILTYNCYRQQKNLQIFEISKIYHDLKPIKSEMHLAILITGEIAKDIINCQNWNSSLFYLKYLLKRICEILNYDFQLLNFDNWKLDDKLFHPYQNASISASNKQIGFIATINPRAINKLHLEYPCYYLEINLANLLQNFTTKAVTYKSFSDLPQTIRDFSFVINRELDLTEIEKYITEISLKVLLANDIKEARINCQIFDIYDKLNDQDKISCAFNLKIISFVQLTDSIIKTIEQEVILNISEKFSAILKTEYDKSN